MGDHAHYAPQIPSTNSSVRSGKWLVLHNVLLSLIAELLTYISKGVAVGEKKAVKDASYNSQWLGYSSSKLVGAARIQTYPNTRNMQKANLPTLWIFPKHSSFWGWGGVVGNPFCPLGFLAASQPAHTSDLLSLCDAHRLHITLGCAHEGIMKAPGWLQKKAPSAGERT